VLHSAQEAGHIPADVTVNEVIALTIGLVWAAQQPGGSSDLIDRLLSTAIYGLAAPG
jgi:hypothetical protein